MSAATCFSTWRKDLYDRHYILETLQYTLQTYKEPQQKIRKKKEMSCSRPARKRNKKIVIVQPTMPPQIRIQLVSRPFRAKTDLHSRRQKKEAPRHSSQQELRRLLFSLTVVNGRPGGPYHHCVRRATK